MPISMLFIFSLSIVSINLLNCNSVYFLSKKLSEKCVKVPSIFMFFVSLFFSSLTLVSAIDDDFYEVQVVSWYDNENSYTSQMVRTIKYFAELA